MKESCKRCYWERDRACYVRPGMPLPLVKRIGSSSHEYSRSRACAEWEPKEDEILEGGD